MSVKLVPNLWTLREFGKLRWNQKAQTKIYHSKSDQGRSANHGHMKYRCSGRVTTGSVTAGAASTYHVTLEIL